MTYVPDPIQAKVIGSTAPVLVVLGGAGTGKTSTAAAAGAAHLRRTDDQVAAARRNARATDAPVPTRTAATRVLLLSFSRTAVAQVVERASAVVGSLMSRIEVATFDGFAWRVLHDFGAHYGHPPPLHIIGRADSAIPGAAPGLTYDQLIPAASVLLRGPSVGAHYRGRWSLVICDEFQDTDDEEWGFLQLIAPGARRILLGDVNQAIYAAMKHTDPDARVASALALPGAERVDLAPASKRDRSGVLPAAAEAARRRQFGDPAIREAIEGGQLRLVRTRSGGAHDEVARIVRGARTHGQTVSVFTHTITATSELSDALTAAGIVHEQVGFGEAYAEAVKAQFALVSWALGQPADHRRAVAVYLAAITSGTAPPPLAGQIQARTNPGFERAMQSLGADLAGAGRATPPDHARLADVITGAWDGIGTGTARGQGTWAQAARRTATALRQVAGGQDLPVAARILQEVHDAALVGNAHMRPHPVQVMNLHQTKGREADVTVLVVQPREYHGSERPPYLTGSRLVYVSLTRARHEAYVVVSGQAHDLWQPLIDTCTQYTPTPAPRTNPA